MKKRGIFSIFVPGMKQVAIILALLLMPLLASAGEPDAGTWTSVAVKHAFNPKYSMTVRAEFLPHTPGTYRIGEGR